MSTYNLEMDISVSAFKQHCLEMIRQVERTGAPVAITRHGRVVAQLRRPAAPQPPRARPWERLRAAGGRLLAAAGESVLAEEDFEATR
jgi:antitoxin (DNA-binding transcriptional repressor) of toxin-antitoxin stability system